MLWVVYTGISKQGIVNYFIYWLWNISCMSLPFNHFTIIHHVHVRISLFLCNNFVLFCENRKRNDDNIRHLFVHLNLCIALALGLVVFLAGIETARGKRVSSTDIAFTAIVLSSILSKLLT